MIIYDEPDRDHYVRIQADLRESNMTTDQYITIFYDGLPVYLVTVLDSTNTVGDLLLAVPDNLAAQRQAAAAFFFELGEFGEFDYEVFTMSDMTAEDFDRLMEHCDGHPLCMFIDNLLTRLKAT